MVLSGLMLCLAEIILNLLPIEPEPDLHSFDRTMSETEIRGDEEDEGRRLAFLIKLK